MLYGFAAPLHGGMSFSDFWFLKVYRILPLGNFVASNEAAMLPSGCWMLPVVDNRKLVAGTCQKIDLFTMTFFMNK